MSSPADATSLPQSPTRPIPTAPSSNLDTAAASSIDDGYVADANVKPNIDAADDGAVEEIVREEEDDDEKGNQKKKKSNGAKKKGDDNREGDENYHRYDTDAYANQCIGNADSPDRTHCGAEDHNQQPQRKGSNAASNHIDTANTTAADDSVSEHAANSKPAGGGGVADANGTDVVPTVVASESVVDDGYVADAVTSVVGAGDAQKDDDDAVVVNKSPAAGVEGDDASANPAAISEEDAPPDVMQQQPDDDPSPADKGGIAGDAMLVSITDVNPSPLQEGAAATTAAHQHGEEEQRQQPALQPSDYDADVPDATVTPTHEGGDEDGARVIEDPSLPVIMAATPTDPNNNNKNTTITRSNKEGGGDQQQLQAAAVGGGLGIHNNVMSPAFEELMASLKPRVDPSADDITQLTSGGGGGASDGHTNHHHHHHHSQLGDEKSPLTYNVAHAASKFAANATNTTSIGIIHNSHQNSDGDSSHKSLGREHTVNTTSDEGSPANGGIGSRSRGVAGGSSASRCDEGTGSSSATNADMPRDAHSSSAGEGATRNSDDTAGRRTNTTPSHQGCNTDANPSSSGADDRSRKTHRHDSSVMSAGSTRRRDKESSTSGGGGEGRSHHHSSVVVSATTTDNHSNSSGMMSDGRRLGTGGGVSSTTNVSSPNQHTNHHGSGSGSGGGHHRQLPSSLADHHHYGGGSTAPITHGGPMLHGGHMLAGGEHHHHQHGGSGDAKGSNANVVHLPPTNAEGVHSITSDNLATHLLQTGVSNGFAMRHGNTTGAAKGDGTAILVAPSNRSPKNGGVGGGGAGGGNTSKDGTPSAQQAAGGGANHHPAGDRGASGLANGAAAQRQSTNNSQYTSAGASANADGSPHRRRDGTPTKRHRQRNENANSNTDGDSNNVVTGAPTLSGGCESSDANNNSSVLTSGRSIQTLYGTNTSAMNTNPHTTGSDTNSAKNTNASNRLYSDGDNSHMHGRGHKSDNLSGGNTSGGNRQVTAATTSSDNNASGANVSGGMPPRHPNTHHPGGKGDAAVHREGDNGRGRSGRGKGDDDDGGLGGNHPSTLSVSKLGIKLGSHRSAFHERYSNDVAKRFGHHNTSSGAAGNGEKNSGGSGGDGSGGAAPGRGLSGKGGKHREKKSSSSSGGGKRDESKKRSQKEREDELKGGGDRGYNNNQAASGGGATTATTTSGSGTKQRNNTGDSSTQEDKGQPNTQASSLPNNNALQQHDAAAASTIIMPSSNDPIGPQQVREQGTFRHADADDYDRDDDMEWPISPLNAAGLHIPSPATYPMGVQVGAIDGARGRGGDGSGGGQSGVFDQDGFPLHHIGVIESGDDMGTAVPPSRGRFGGLRNRQPSPSTTPDDNVQHNGAQSLAAGVTAQQQLAAEQHRTAQMAAAIAAAMSVAGNSSNTPPNISELALLAESYYNASQQPNGASPMRPDDLLMSALSRGGNGRIADASLPLVGLGGSGGKSYSVASQMAPKTRSQLMELQAVLQQVLGAGTATSSAGSSGRSSRRSPSKGSRGSANDEQNTSGSSSRSGNVNQGSQQQLSRVTPSRSNAGTVAYASDNTVRNAPLSATMPPVNGSHQQLAPLQQQQQQVATNNHQQLLNNAPLDASDPNALLNALVNLVQQQQQQIANYAAGGNGTVQQYGVIPPQTAMLSQQQAPRPFATSNANSPPNGSSGSGVGYRRQPVIRNLASLDGSIPSNLTGNTTSQESATPPSSAVALAPNSSSGASINVRANSRGAVPRMRMELTPSITYAPTTTSSNEVSMPTNGLAIPNGGMGEITEADLLDAFAITGDIILRGNKRKFLSNNSVLSTTTGRSLTTEATTALMDGEAGDGTVDNDGSSVLTGSRDGGEGAMSLTTTNSALVPRAAAVRVTEPNGNGGEQKTMRKTLRDLLEPALEKGRNIGLPSAAITKGATALTMFSPHQSTTSAANRLPRHPRSASAQALTSTFDTESKDSGFKRLRASSNSYYQKVVVSRVQGHTRRKMSKGANYRRGNMAGGTTSSATVQQPGTNSRDSRSNGSRDLMNDNDNSNTTESPVGSSSQQRSANMNPNNKPGVVVVVPPPNGSSRRSGKSPQSANIPGGSGASSTHLSSYVLPSTIVSSWMTNTRDGGSELGDSESSMRRSRGNGDGDGNTTNSSSGKPPTSSCDPRRGDGSSQTPPYTNTPSDPIYTYTSSSAAQHTILSSSQSCVSGSMYGVQHGSGGSGHGNANDDNDSMTGRHDSNGGSRRGGSVGPNQRDDHHSTNNGLMRTRVFMAPHRLSDSSLPVMSMVPHVRLQENTPTSRGTISSSGVGQIATSGGSHPSNSSNNGSPHGPNSTTTGTSGAAPTSSFQDPSATTTTNTGGSGSGSGNQSSGHFMPQQQQRQQNVYANLYPNAMQQQPYVGAPQQFLGQQQYFAADGGAARPPQYFAPPHGPNTFFLGGGSAQGPLLQMQVQQQSDTSSTSGNGGGPHGTGRHYNYTRDGQEVQPVEANLLLSVLTLLQNVSAQQQGANNRQQAQNALAATNSSLDINALANSLRMLMNYNSNSHPQGGMSTSPGVGSGGGQGATTSSSGSGPGQPLFRGPHGLSGQGFGTNGATSSSGSGGNQMSLTSNGATDGSSRGGQVQGSNELPPLHPVRHHNNGPHSGGSQGAGGYALPPSGSQVRNPNPAGGRHHRTGGNTSSSSSNGSPSGATVDNSVVMPNASAMTLPIAGTPPGNDYLRPGTEGASSTVGHHPDGASGSSLVNDRSSTPSDASYDTQNSGGHRHRRLLTNNYSNAGTSCTSGSSLSHQQAEIGQLQEQFVVLQRTFRDLTGQCSKVLTRLASERQKVTDRESVMRSRAEADVRAARNRRIDVNVGGTRFTFSEASLAKFPGTYLDIISRVEYDVERDPDGCLFIDRDPDAFKDILHFIRGGDLNALRSRTTSELKTLMSEARYYGLDMLVMELNCVRYHWYCESDYGHATLYGTTTARDLRRAIGETTSGSEPWSDAITQGTLPDSGSSESNTTSSVRRPMPALTGSLANPTQIGQGHIGDSSSPASTASSGGSTSGAPHRYPRPNRNTAIARGMRICTGVKYSARCFATAVRVDDTTAYFFGGCASNDIFFKDLTKLTIMAVTEDEYRRHMMTNFGTGFYEDIEHQRDFQARDGSQHHRPIQQAQLGNPYRQLHHSMLPPGALLQPYRPEKYHFELAPNKGVPPPTDLSVDVVGTRHTSTPSPDDREATPALPPGAGSAATQSAGGNDRSTLSPRNLSQTQSQTNTTPSQTTEGGHTIYNSSLGGPLVVRQSAGSHASSSGSSTNGPHQRRMHIKSYLGQEIYEPTPRSGHSMVHIKSHLVVFYGNLHSEHVPTVEAYSLGTNTWQRLKLMGCAVPPRSGHTTTVINANTTNPLVVLIGGKQIFPTSKRLHDIYVGDFDFAHGVLTWQRMDIRSLAPFNVFFPHHECYAFAADRSTAGTTSDNHNTPSTIQVQGSQNSSTFGGAGGLFRNSSAHHSNTTGSEMSGPHTSSVGSGSNNGTVANTNYNGSSTDANTHGGSNPAHSALVSMQMMQNVANKLLERSYHSAVCYKDRYIYIFGGIAEDRYSNDLLELDTKRFSLKLVKGGPHLTNTASENVLDQALRGDYAPANYNAPIPRSGHVAAVHGDCMYIVGSYGSDDGENSVVKLHQYSMATQVWSVISTSGQAPAQRAAPAVVLFPENAAHGVLAKITVVGGYSVEQNNCFNDVMSMYV